MNIKRFFGQVEKAPIDNTEAILDAHDRAHAVIEFDLDGSILIANQNFLTLMAYDLREVVGNHHRMFVDPAETGSANYAEFWRDLRSGQFKSSEYKRLGKGGKEVWIRGTYNPILDDQGNPQKVVNFATDVTEQKLCDDNVASQLAAISRSQAVIEFTVDGEIITANDNFLNALGYRLNEIRGHHHRMFIEPGYATSQAYLDFWSALRRGEFQSAEYMCLDKGGKEVWMQATYNPILDADGKPRKIVKFATSISDINCGESMAS